MQDDKPVSYTHLDVYKRQVRERMRALGVQLEVTDAALDLLAERGFDPTYGARPLRRCICTQDVYKRQASSNARLARGERSPRLPMGVPTIVSLPAISFPPCGKCGAFPPRPARPGR